MSTQPILHWLFGPHFFDVGAVLCIGIGFAIALSPDPKDISGALWFFGIAALLAIGRAGHWLVTAESLPMPKPIWAAILFGSIGALWITAHTWVASKLPHVVHSQEVADIQLSITCDNVPLPMAYRGDLWILNTVMVNAGGLGKLMAPPNNKALWPEDGVRGFGYKCTVKNHGTKAAFGVSFPVIISKLNLMRTGDTWTTGDVKETHSVLVSIPQPLSQQGSDQFSFYVCSYDPDGSFDITLPLTASVNSDDPKNKREMSVKITSIAGNPFTVPPKQLAISRPPALVKTPNPAPTTESRETTNQQHCETGSLCNQDSQVNAPQTVTNNFGSPPVKITASAQKQRQVGSEWETSFTISSNESVQTGDLRLKCDGPVLRAGISRIDPMELVTGSNGPAPNDPNEAIYELKAETLIAGKTITVAVYSVQPVTVISGTLGAQEIIIKPQ